jgi:hypothetical protein
MRETQLMKPQLDLTIAATRNSEAKYLPRQSFEKVKMDKYRFCSPKGASKPKEVNSSLEMKQTHLFNRIAKEHRQNASERKTLGLLG